MVAAMARAPVKQVQTCRDEQQADFEAWSSGRPTPLSCEFGNVSPTPIGLWGVSASWRGCIRYKARILLSDRLADGEERLYMAASIICAAADD